MTAASHIPVPVLAKSKGPVASLLTFGGKEGGMQFADNNHIFIYTDEIPQQAAGGLQHSAQVQEEQK